MTEVLRTATLINIDVKPEVSFEIEARVVVSEDGKPRMVPFPVSRWLAHLGRLTGKTVRLTVTRQKGLRSSAQNRYLWAVVYEDYFNGLLARAHDVGLVLPFKDKDALHYHLKHKYVGQNIQTFEGETIMGDPSTTLLDVEQFGNYITAIMAEAAQRSIYIRPANKDWQYESEAA